MYYFISFKNVQIRLKIIAGLFILFPLFLIQQGGFLNKHRDHKLKYKKEFVGFMMGVKSPDFMTTLYPAYKDTSQYLLHIQNHIIPFDILYKAVVWDTARFYGEIEEVKVLPTDTAYSSIKGWVYDKQTHESPELIAFKNHQSGIIVGYAVCGKKRKDIKNKTGYGKWSGFEGFLKNDVHKP